MEPLNSALFDKCYELINHNNQEDNSGKNEELLAIGNIFSNFERLNIEGIALFAESKFAAFAIFSRHLDGSYIVHIEKSDKRIKGAAQVINKECAKYLSDKCVYINREQDLGIPGLRHAKKSYAPEFVLINYDFFLK